jgi:nucleotide-binding universal stress UspA family protein
MIRIERILCPTDLSEESDEALRYALALARAYKAKLLVCHCVRPAAFVDEAARDAFAWHFESALSARLSMQAKLPPCEGLIIHEHPGHGIVQAAMQQCADLIVMRSRRRPTTAALLGSTAETVCRTAPCPVLVTHSDEREWVGRATGEIDLRKILIAHDFSNDSELALRYAVSLAQEYQAELHLLHVLPYALAPALTTPPQSLEPEFQRTLRLLQQSVPDEVQLWCKVIQTVKSGQPYREILSYAEEQQADLICLGVHGAGFAMRALFGSNADRVLRQAPCPVLIARPLRHTSLPETVRPQRPHGE